MVTESPQASPPLERTALLVAAFDSQLKWVAAIGAALRAKGFRCRFVVPSDIRHSVSERQLADYAGVETEHLTWDEMISTALTVDVLVLGVQGPRVVQVVHEVHSLLAGTDRKPPVTVAGWVGVIIEKLTAGYLERYATDVVAVNSRSDLRDFQSIAESLGLPTENLLLSGLPLLGGAKQPTAAGPIESVLFADQPTVPQTRDDRLYLYERLVAYAESHPDRKVVLKPRHRPGEDTFHPMKYHPEVLLAGRRLPDNFSVDYTPISERLADLDLMLTVSSTAALEAVEAGVQTAFVADLSVREQLGNHIFLSSGLLRTFEQIDKDDIGIPAPAWVDDYFFNDTGIPPAVQVATRVLELIESGERPSVAARSTSFFESQHRLRAYREEVRADLAHRARFPRVARRLRLLALAVLPRGAASALKSVLRRIWPGLVH